MGLVVTVATPFDPLVVVEVVVVVAFGCEALGASVVVAGVGVVV